MVTATTKINFLDSLLSKIGSRMDTVILGFSPSGQHVISCTSDAIQLHQLHLNGKDIVVLQRVLMIPREVLHGSGPFGQHPLYQHYLKLIYPKSLSSSSQDFLVHLSVELYSPLDKKPQDDSVFVVAVVHEFRVIHKEQLFVIPEQSHAHDLSRCDFSPWSTLFCLSNSGSVVNFCVHKEAGPAVKQRWKRLRSIKTRERRLECPGCFRNGWFWSSRRELAESCECGCQPSWSGIPLNEQQLTRTVVDEEKLVIQIVEAFYPSKRFGRPVDLSFQHLGICTDEGIEAVFIISVTLSHPRVVGSHLHYTTRAAVDLWDGAAYVNEFFDAQRFMVELRSSNGNQRCDQGFVQRCSKILKPDPNTSAGAYSVDNYRMLTEEESAAILRHPTHPDYVVAVDH